MKPLTRNEVAVDSTWILADLFPTIDEWRSELSAIEKSLDTVTRHQGKLGEGPATLLACLDARDAMQARLQRVWAFASLRQSEDGTDPARQADAALAAATYARVDASLGEVLDAPYMIYDRAKTSDMRFEPFTVAGESKPNTFNLYEWTYEI